MRSIFEAASPHLIRPMFRRSLYLSMLVASGLAGLAADPVTITEVDVEPAQTILTNADQSVQFLVTLKMSDGTLRDATHAAEFFAQLPDGKGNATDVIAIDHGRLTPKSDGKVTVSVAVID